MTLHLICFFLDNFQVLLFLFIDIYSITFQFKIVFLLHCIFLIYGLLLLNKLSFTNKTYDVLELIIYLIQIISKNLQHSSCCID